jgi:hypothetical protein
MSAATAEITRHVAAETKLSHLPAGFIPDALRPPD